MPGTKADAVGAEPEMMAPSRGTSWVPVDLAQLLAAVNEGTILPLLVASVGACRRSPSRLPGPLPFCVLPALHTQLFLFAQVLPPGGDIVRITGLAPLAPWWPRTPCRFCVACGPGTRSHWVQGTGSTKGETEAQSEEVAC